MNSKTKESGNRDNMENERKIAKTISIFRELQKIILMKREQNPLIPKRKQLGKTKTVLKSKIKIKL